MGISGFAAHLHVRSGFSYGQGVAYPDELSVAAAGMGYHYLSVTDRDGLYGVPKFLSACAEYGLAPIVGAEITVCAHGERGHVVLLCESMEGYAALCKLISRYRTAPGTDGAHPSAKERRFPACSLQTLLEEASRTRGLICLTGAIPHGLLARLLELGKWSEAKTLLAELAGAFGRDSLYAELTDDRTRYSRRRLHHVAGLAAECGVSTVATNEVTYIDPADHKLSEAMWAAYNTTSLPGPGHRPTDQLYLKPSWKMEHLFRDYPEALANTSEIVGRCAGAVSLGGEVLVPAYSPSGERGDAKSAREKLLSLVLRGARWRYGRPTLSVKRRLRRELRCIGELGFTSYFLFAYEAREIADELGTPMTGRGSSANSLVAHCLGLTQPDPMEHSLVFERFMHEGRTADPPDIDLDVCSELRDELRDELIRRYADHGAGVAATASTFSLRGAIRAASRALGYPPPEIGELARNVPHRIRDRDTIVNPEGSGIWSAALSEPAMRGHALQDRKRYALLLDLSQRLAGRLHQPGTHLGGLVVGTDTQHLSEIVPMEHSGMEGLLRVQYDKDGLEAAGLPKLDVLGLKMHTALRKAGELISQRTEERLDPVSPPPGDKSTYALIRTGENAGLFQLESPGQMQLTRRLKPRKLADIQASISLFRPGPVRGDLVTPYVLRRNGKQAYEVPLPELEEILRPTYGVLLYQEQVLECARAVAGYTLAEADEIRRAMTKDRGPAAMEGIREEFLRRSVSRGVPEERARQVVDWIEGFAAYGFSQAHAASFAELAYASAYMRVHYPAEFFASELNSMPMGYYSPRILLNEARRTGVRILRSDIHLSGEGCTVEEDGRAIRVGLCYCKGLSRRAIQQIRAEREERPFSSVGDLYRRTSVGRDELENLIRAGFLDSMDSGGAGSASSGSSRRELLQQMKGLPNKRVSGSQKELPAKHPAGQWESGRADDNLASLPSPPDEAERMQRAVLSLDVGGHPLQAYRRALCDLGVTPARDIRGLPKGTRVRAAGIMECLQRPPTKSGARVYFVIIEDESGLLQATAFRDTYERYGHHLHRAGALLLEGVVEQGERRGFSFVVDRIGDLARVLERRGARAEPDASSLRRRASAGERGETPAGLTGT